MTLFALRMLTTDMASACALVCLLVLSKTAASMVVRIAA